LLKDRKLKFATTMSQLKKQIIDGLITYGGVDPNLFTSFTFEVDKTPLSSIKYPLIAVFLYCLGIPMLQRFMKNRQPPPLKYLMIFHNLFLSVASFFVALLIILELMSFREQGYDWFRLYCALNYQEQQRFLTLLYYVNYLLKYYEFVDTIFLALKHKPIGFLHAYHHPATLVLTWGQLVDATGVQWLIILLNLCVHCVMYFYYGLAAMKIEVPFKKIVTILQIVQFIIDLFAAYGAWGSHYFRGVCFGTARAGAIGSFILTSYLYLFIDFYDSTYNSKDKKVTKILKED